MNLIKKKWLALSLALLAFGALAQFGADRIQNFAIWAVDQVSGTPSTPSSGLKVYSKSADGKLYKLDSSGVESSIGSGAGGKNFFARTGTTADYSTSGQNATYDNGGSLDGTFSISTSASELIDDVNQINVFKYVASSSSQNDFLATAAIDIPLGFTGRVIGYEFYYKTSGFSDDEIEWQVKCTTDSVVLTDSIDSTLDACTPSDNSSCKYTGFVYVPTACTQLEVGPHFTGSISTSDTLIWDELKIADDLVQTSKLMEMTGWEAFTPTGDWTTNSTYSGFKRRVGDTMEVQGFISLAGAPNNVTLRINIPGGLTIDSDKMPTPTSLQTVLGQMSSIDASTNDRMQGVVTYHSTSQVGINPYLEGNNDATKTEITTCNATSPFTYASGDNVHFRFSVPISGWSVTGDHVVSATDNVQPARVQGNDDGTDITNATVWFIGFDATTFDEDVLFTNVASSNSTSYTSTTYATILKTGYYRLSGQWYSQDTDLDAGDTFQARISVNGTSIVNNAGMIQYSAASVTFTAPAATTLYLTKGDKISFGIYQATGSNITLTSTAAKSFFEITRVDKSPITNIPHAMLFQNKVLTGDVSTDITLTDLTFSNLVVGRVYEVFFSGFFFFGGTEDGAVTIEHNSVTLGKTRVVGTTGDREYRTMRAIFTAATTTVTFVASSLTANLTLNGNSTYLETFATIKAYPVGYESTAY